MMYTIATITTSSMPTLITCWNTKAGLADVDNAMLTSYTGMSPHELGKDLDHNLFVLLSFNIWSFEIKFHKWMLNLAGSSLWITETKMQMTKRKMKIKWECWYRRSAVFCDLKTASG